MDIFEMSKIDFRKKFGVKKCCKKCRTFFYVKLKKEKKINVNSKNVLD